MVRTSEQDRGPSPAKRWANAGGNPRGSRPKRGSDLGQSKSDRVWGKLPKHTLDQSGLTALFELQSQLNAVLRKQARLSKQAVPEVRSTQAEQLRRINEQIARGFGTSRKVEQLFARDITVAQRNSEDMIRRQGKRTIDTRNVQRSVPIAEPPSLRRKVRFDKELKEYLVDPRELGTLRGLLLRDFSRAKARGYQGPPNRWLRGPTAAKAILKLRHKGVIDPLWTGRLSVFDRRSPLHYVVSGCMASETTSIPGFCGERLHGERINVMALAGQARAVKRCPKRQWPRSERGHAWPTFPTLFESWERLMRNGPLRSVDNCLTSFKLEDVKRPSRQVLPGQSVRTIRLFVRGIRADSAVPGKFLAYFQYRWGFLILRRDRALPKDLVSFLTRLWKTDITRMFLVYPIRYNEALRRLPSVGYYRLLGWVAGGQEAVPHGERRPDRGLRRSLNRQNARSSATLERHSPSNESDRGVRLS